MGPREVLSEQRGNSPPSDETTMAPSSVELGTTSNAESSALYMGPPPCKKMSVGRKDESSTPKVLYPPPCDNVLLDRRD
jgi:hypothetical protein